MRLWQAWHVSKLWKRIPPVLANRTSNIVNWYEN